MKQYRITYVPTIEITYELVNPYDELDLANMTRRIYVPIPPKHREEEVVYIKAPNKDLAKCLFAASLVSGGQYAAKPVEGGYEPLVLDCVRNIKKIEEV